MSAGTYNFVNTGNEKEAIEQGATFDRSLVYKDAAGVAINLTGFTARMQVRASVKAVPVLLELNTTNGRIIITALAGAIRLLVAATDTALLTFRSGVYDLEIISATGVVIRLLEGEIELSKEVTR